MHQQNLSAKGRYGVHDGVLFTGKEKKNNAIGFKEESKHIESKS